MRAGGRELNAVGLEALLKDKCDVLLVLWAPWHLRSVEVLSAVETFVSAQAPQVLLAGINVDREVQSAMRLGLRALPLCVYYRQGVEVARTPCPAGAGGLPAWCAEQMARQDGRPMAANARPHSLGAFNADPGFQARLLGELRDLAERGLIKYSRVPCWDGEHGSIMGAAARTTRPDLVEERTGLPYSFFCALEFLRVDWGVSLIDSTIGAVAPAADLTNTALALVHGVLADPQVDWKIVLDDERIEVLRSRWLRLVERMLSRLSVAQSEWDEVLVGLSVLRSESRDPFRTVQDALIDFVVILSPPPAHDDEMWASALSFYGAYLQTLLVEAEAGWTPEDFAFEGRRLAWFVAREQLEPDGEFNEASLALAQQQWTLDHGDAEIRQGELMTEVENSMPLYTHRLCQRLIGLVRTAPRVS